MLFSSYAIYGFNYKNATMIDLTPNAHDPECNTAAAALELPASRLRWDKTND